MSTPNGYVDDKPNSKKPGGMKIIVFTMTCLPGLSQGLSLTSLET